MKPKVVSIANPASLDGSPIEVDLTSSVSDRANRYRAVRVLEQLPENQRDRCHFCGNDDEPLLAGHVDGNEDNGDPSNISPTCRSCNNAIATNFTRVNVGRRTRQFNPAAPAATSGEYIWAVNTLRYGRSRSSILRAVAKIQSTPHAKRNRFIR
jgi:hypothetical protein